MDYIKKVQEKYSYLTDDEAKYFVDMAKDVVIGKLYPHDYSISCDTYEIPSRCDWILVRIALGFIERDGLSNVVAYKENGVSMTFDKTGVSEDLLAMLVPCVGVIGGGNK